MKVHCENPTSGIVGLDEVMDAFRCLPVDQLIAESILRTNSSETGPHLAGAAVLGFTRSSQYVDTARGVIGQILDNAEQISWHMNAYSILLDVIGDDYDASPLAKQELGKAVNHQLGAKTLSLRSEVHWHLYVECLDRAWYFMLNSAKLFDPSFTLKSSQQLYIDTIHEFRNHMAHRDKAILDVSSPDWCSMSQDAGGWYEVGYKRDNLNRIEFNPVSGPRIGKSLRMPMNQEGFQRFKNVIKYTYERLQQLALDRLMHQFVEHPDSIPPADQVGCLASDYIEPV